MAKSTSLWGMDLVGVANLADEFDKQSGELGEIDKRVVALLASKAWVGGDRALFDQDWQNHGAKLIGGCAAALAGVASYLRKQAEEQRKASAVTSGQVDAAPPMPTPGRRVNIASIRDPGGSSDVDDLSNDEIEKHRARNAQNEAAEPPSLVDSGYKLDSAVKQDNLLKAFDGASDAELKAFANANPRLVHEPARISGTAQYGGGSTIENAQEAQKWWNNLTPERKELYIQYYPGLVGNLNGVDYDSRNRANINTLDALEAGKLGELNDENRIAIDTLRVTLRDGGNTPQTAVKILQLDVSSVGDDSNFANVAKTGVNPSSQILASVSVGDMANATHVSFVVPGMGNNVGHSMQGLVNSGKILNGGIQNNLDSFGKPGATSATVIALPFEAPEMTGGNAVTENKMAERGGLALSNVVDGVAAVAVPGAELNLIAHSYGTTTTASSLKSIETHLSKVVLLGSAGIADETVEHLNILDQSKFVPTYDERKIIIGYTHPNSPITFDEHMRPNIYYSTNYSDIIAETGIRTSGREHPREIWGAKKFGQPVSVDGRWGLPGLSDSGQTLKAPQDHDFLLNEAEKKKGFIKGYLAPETTSGHDVARIVAGLPPETYTIPGPYPAPPAPPEPRERPVPPEPSPQTGPQPAPESARQPVPAEPAPAEPAPQPGVQPVPGPPGY